LAGRDDHGQDRSSYERFAIPYSFKPQLSFSEAVISAGGAFLRILLGSLLFAVWGTYTLLAWSAIRNVFWRGAALLALISLFAVSFTLLMLAISALVRMFWPQDYERPQRPGPTTPL
jgi:hypothetical protein